MATTLTHMLDLQKIHFDAANAAGRMTVDVLEKWADLNAATARAVLQEGTDTAHALRTARDPQHVIDAMAAAGKPAAERWLGYSRDAYAIANGARGELTKIFQTQRAEHQRQVGDWIASASESAPVGAEPAVAACRLAFTNANAALDTFFQAAQAAADWAESNISAAMSATIDTVAASSDAAKGRARKAANA
ncbi:phasin family domain-containing protein [Burkholderiales bacterium GJ-E10]|nr:phasin family domain-containing protein [Burkholderiales bacterium GJ-E10]